MTGQQTARGASNYRAKLKQRLKEEGADKLLTNCQQLKMTASDEKHRATDVAIDIFLNRNILANYAWELGNSEFVQI